MPTRIRAIVVVSVSRAAKAARRRVGAASLVRPARADLDLPVAALRAVPDHEVVAARVPALAAVDAVVLRAAPFVVVAVVDDDPLPRALSARERGPRRVARPEGG